VGVGAAAALLVFLLVFVATSWPDTPAHPEAARPLRVRAVSVIRKADMPDEPSRDVGADTSAGRAPAPRVVILPAPPPQAAPSQLHVQRRDHVGGGPASPPSVEAPASTSPPPPPRTDVAPTGGRAPLRPIVTSNPYGGS
jgi:hypothetical protein